MRAVRADAAHQRNTRCARVVPGRVLERSGAGQVAEITLAAGHGVKIVSPTLWGIPWWQDGVQPNFNDNDIDYWMDAVLAANPNALVIPRFPVDQPAMVGHSHPDDMTLCRRARGLGAASANWRRDAATQIGNVIRLLEARYGDHIIGYHVCGQSTAEWFYDGFWDGKYAGYEAPALDAFKAFL